MGHVFRRCHRILRSREDAEDATQEVFLNVFRALPDYRFERPFTHWLNKITLNRCLLFLDRRKREERRRSEFALEPERTGGSSLSDPILRARLEESLDMLSGRARTAIVLRFVEEWSFREIAEHLEMKESTVKMQVSRAMRRLRTIFDRVERGTSESEEER